MGDELYSFCHSESGGYLYKFDQTCKTDEYTGTTNIQCVASTKIFDFGLPFYTKSITNVNIGFGSVVGEPIKVGFVTENGIEDEYIITLDGELFDSVAHERSAQYVQNRVFRPCIKFAHKIGLKIESEGDLSVDAISINYKINGGDK